MIKRLPANLNGRDFICGDIHGSYSCVLRFLEEINFDFAIDRLFCVGDLVDRGPDNEAVLLLLLEPWFFSVKGNHEELMCEHFKLDGNFHWWVHNGGAWGMRHLTEQSDESLAIRDLINEVVDNLPYLITVENTTGIAFHIMHAELLPPAKTQYNHETQKYEPNDFQFTDKLFANTHEFEKIATIKNENGNIVTWGRYRFMNFYKQHVDERFIEKMKRRNELENLDRMFNEKLAHIYSGHTIVKQPIQFYGQTNLDTMAYGSYNTDAPEWQGLTVTEPKTGKFWLVNDKQFKEVQPVIFN